jgi:hypothetical protein
MSITHLDGFALLEKSWMAAERIRDRCRRFAAAMDAAGVPYAVIGGNAVGLWVASRDEDAVRNTKDVDVLLRRSDLDAAKAAGAAAGFLHATAGAGEVHFFLDGPNGSFKNGVHVIFAGEKVKPEDPAEAPDVADSELVGGMRVLRLEALVRMKLTAHRLHDRVHVADMMGVGLIDATWPARYPPALAARLQAILDNPNG